MKLSIDETSVLFQKDFIPEDCSKLMDEAISPAL